MVDTLNAQVDWNRPANDIAAPAYKAFDPLISRFHERRIPDSDTSQWMTTNREQMISDGYNPSDIDKWLLDYGERSTRKQLVGENPEKVDPAVLLSKVFSLMPRETYARLRESGVLSPDEFDKMIYARAYNLTPTQINVLYPQLKEMHGGFSPYSAKPIERGFFAKMAESAVRGWSDIELDFTLGNAWFNNDFKTIDEVMAYKRKLRMREVVDPIDGSLVSRMFYGAANVTSGMARSMFASLDKAAVGAIAGAEAGLATGIALPTLGEEPLTTGTGALLGAGGGMVAGMADFWYRQGVGAMYADAVDLGYDPNVSGYIAAVMAVPYALIEQDQILSLAPEANAVAGNTIRKVLANGLKWYGKTWAREVVLEEVPQQAMQIVARDLSAWASDRYEIFRDPDYLAARGWELWNTFKEAGVSMALLPLPGAAMNVANGVISLPEQQRLKSVTSEVEAPEANLDIAIPEPPQAGQTPAEAPAGPQAPATGEKQPEVELKPSEGPQPYNPQADNVLDDAVQDIDDAIARNKEDLRARERSKTWAEEKVQDFESEDENEFASLDLDVPFDPSVTKEEQELLDVLTEEEAEPAELTPEESEIVNPRLHIGNVTQRMRRVWADLFTRKNANKQAIALIDRWSQGAALTDEEIQFVINEMRRAGVMVKPDDIHPFTEKGWKTNRTGIPLTRAEARNLEATLVEYLDNLLLREEWTQDDITNINITWGDIKNLRIALEMPVGRKPYKVKYAKKHVVVEIQDVKRRIQESLRLGEAMGRSGLSKKSLAEYSWSDLLTEQEALRGAMRQAVNQSRKAFKAGAEQVKQYYRDLLARQRAIRLEKARRVALMKKISRKPSKTIDPFYRLAIMQWISIIDPKGRTQRTEARLQSLRNFLKANPDKIGDIPVKLLTRMAQIPVTKFSSQDLEVILKERHRLEKLGQLKQQLKVAADKRERQRDTSSLIDETKGARPEAVPRDPYEFNTDPVGRIKSITRAGWLISLRPSRILDWLGGGKGTFNTLWHRIFYDRANTAHQTELNEIDRRRKAMDGIVKKLGVKYEDLARRIDVNGHQVPIQKLMGIYAASLNERALAAILGGNGYSKSFVAAAIRALPDEYRQWADVIIAEYAETWPRLRQVIVEQTGEIPPEELSYTAMVRLDRNGLPNAKTIEDQVLQRLGIRRSKVQRGFTIARKNISELHQTPIDINLVDVWLEQVRKQEHYMSHIALVRRMRGILANRELKTELDSRFGKEVLPRLNRYVDRIANPVTYDAYTWLTQASKIMRRNVAYAYLGANLLTISKQLPSLMLYNYEAGIGHMLSSLGELATNYHEVVDRIRRLDPQVAHASIERELEEMRRIAPEGYRRLLHKFGMAGMTGIRFVDGLVRVVGWNAVYQRAIEQGYSEAEAVREAQFATLRTQPAAATKDLAELYTTSEFFNWFTMFTNQLNQLFNIVSYDTFAYWRNGDYQKAASAALCVGASQAIIWSLAKRRMPDSDDDLLDMFSDTALSVIPVIGRYAMAGKLGYDTEIPPFTAAKSIGRVFVAQDKVKAAKKALGDTAALTGVPVVAIKRTARFLDTGHPLELVGGQSQR